MKLWGERELSSIERNLGKVSFTWCDSGRYGQFINECRLSAWRLAMTRNKINAEKIVDIGCSYGSWADNWRDLGFAHTVGIDPNPAVMEKAAPVLDEMHLGFATDAKQWCHQEQCIAANGVLVHILEDEEVVKFLRACADILARDGKFIYSVLNPLYYLSSGRKEWEGENACVRPLEKHRSYAADAGLAIVDEIGTFIDPWALPELEFLASATEIRERDELYRPFTALGDLVRGRSLIPFSEVLFVTERGGT